MNAARAARALLALLAWSVGAQAGQATRGPTATPPLRYDTVVADDGVPLNVVTGGTADRPTLLLLHGAYQSHASWLAQLRDPQLAASYRLVALDLRGHGASGKPWDPAAYSGSRPWASDLRRVIDHYGLLDVVLVGWSFGGFVANAYLWEYGGANLAGVVYVSSHGGLLGAPGAHVPPLPDDLEAFREAGHRFAAVMTVAPVPASVRASTYDSYLMTPPYVRRAMRNTRLDYAAFGERAALPMLFIRGAADAPAQTAALQGLVARLPGAALLTYPGVGHSPFVEATARFDADLATFAARAVMASALRAAATAAEASQVAQARLVVERLRAGFAGGDAAQTLALYAEDVTMHRSDTRPPVVGREAMRPSDEFHAVVRPQVTYYGLEFETSGPRVVVSMRGATETAPLFAAMGLPRVTMRAMHGALEVEDGRIAVMREAGFKPSCERLIPLAIRSTLQWLRDVSDPRLEVVAPGGRPRIDGASAAPWIAAISDWRRASGWTPPADEVADCGRFDP